MPPRWARLIDALLDGAGFVQGSRFLPGGGSDDLTLTRRLGDGLLSGLVNRLFGPYTDPCYGYNACWSCFLESLRVAATASRSRRSSTSESSDRPSCGATRRS